MDNLENYLYVLFAVIYIVSRIIKARSKQKQEKQQQQPRGQTQSQQPGQPQSPPQRKKAFSFEDILKEFEKNLAGEEEEPAYEKPLPVQEIRHEKPAPVHVPEVKQKPNPYADYMGSQRKSIKEEMAEDSASIFLRNENYSIKDKVTSDYVKMLQDPEGFKNAVVLSEIINRKYF